MEVSISLMRAEDVPGVQEVFRTTWLTTYPNEEAGISVADIKDHFKDYLSPAKIARRAEALGHLPPNEVRLVACADNKPIGVCFAEVLADRNTVSRLYVLPAYQHNGVGTRLWEAVQTHLDPARDTYVELATYNQEAKAFYEKLGFVDTGRRFEVDRFHFKSGALMPNMEMKRAATQ